jgi:flagellar basal body-associated protein FliL
MSESKHRINPTAVLGVIGGTAALGGAAFVLSRYNEGLLDESRYFNEETPDSCVLGSHLSFGKQGDNTEIQFVLKNSRGVQVCLPKGPTQSGMIFDRSGVGGVAVQTDYRPYGKGLLRTSPKDPNCIENDALRICAKQTVTKDPEGRDVVKTIYTSDKPVMESGQETSALFTAQFSLTGIDGKPVVAMGISAKPHTNQPALLPTWAVPSAGLGVIGIVGAGIAALIASRKSKQAKTALAIRDAALGTAAQATNTANSARQSEARTLAHAIKLNRQSQAALDQRAQYLATIDQLKTEGNIKDSAFDAVTANNQQLRAHVEELKRAIHNQHKNIE